MPFSHEEKDRFIQKANHARLGVLIIPNSALIKAMLPNQCIPISNEFDYWGNGGAHKAQLALNIVNGSRVVYFAKQGQWDTIYSADIAKWGVGHDGILRAAHKQPSWPPTIQRGALLTQIAKDHYAPLTNEFAHYAGASYKAQLARSITDESERLYFVKVGDWGNVQHFNTAEDPTPTTSPPPQSYTPTHTSHTTHSAAPTPAPSGTIGTAIPQKPKLSDADWNNLKKQNVSFIYIEASKEWEFGENVAQANNRGILCGAYYTFIRADKEGSTIEEQKAAARIQAQQFVNTLRAHPLSLPPAIRVLINPTQSRQTKNELVQAFVNEYNRQTHNAPLIIHTRRIDWGILVGDSGSGWANRYDLWLEDMGKTMPGAWWHKGYRIQQASKTAENLYAFAGSADDLRKYANFGSFSFDSEQLEEFDLLEYVRGDGRVYNLQSFITNEQGETIEYNELLYTQSDDQETTFTQIKHGEWERYTSNEETISLEIDTASGIHPDTGRPYFIQLSQIDETPGGAKFSRWVRIGQLIEQAYVVTSYDKVTGDMINSYPHHSYLSVVARHDEFVISKELVLEDVVELAWLPTPDTPAAERYYYARGLGLVGWDGPAGSSRISQIYSDDTLPECPETVAVATDDETLLTKAVGPTRFVYQPQIRAYKE